MKYTIGGTLLLLRHGSAISLKAGPIEKVVKLLEDLQGKIEKDAKVEQQVYDKFACWCETTTDRKADAINAANQDLRSLGQSILTLQGKISVLGAEMAKLQEDMGKNKEEQADATNIRQKENAAYTAETTEMKEALAAMQTAVVVLRDATTLLQSGDATAMERSKTAIRKVVDALPANAVLKPDQTAFLSEFTSAGRYAPQSESIQGILRDMYDTFADDLESATQREATANTNFEGLIATKSKEFSEMKASYDKKAGEKADAETALADTSQNYDDTQQQKEADIEFFDKTKSSCQKKSDEWDTRSSLRAEELKGVEDALKILTSDEARALFASAIKPGKETGASFLQISRTSSPADKAYQMLRAEARKSRSLRLGMLAVQLRQAKAGHFDEVIGAIDKMITTLKEEGQADIDKRDQCKDEYLNIASKLGDVMWLIEKNDAKIDKLQGLIDKRTAEKEKTSEEIEDVKDQIKQMKKERVEEHADFQHAKKEDMAAIDLLTLAKAKLSSYSQNHTAAFLSEPVFEVSEDQAPDANFATKDSHKGQTKGITSLLEYVISDLHDEVANGIKAEASNQLEFEGLLKAAESLKADLKEKKENLATAIANLGQQKTDEIKSKELNQADLKDENEYKATIKPDCDWMLKAFSGRAAARQAEMDGLSAAKEYLVGAASSSLLEKKAVGFLSLGR